MQVTDFTGQGPIRGVYFLVLIAEDPTWPRRHRRAADVTPVRV
jgi:hypothetical protein